VPYQTVALQIDAGDDTNLSSFGGRKKKKKEEEERSVVRVVLKEENVTVGSM